MNKEESDAMQQLITDAAHKLGEHFDHVQIFASSNTDQGENTRSFTTGVGNWHARHGQASEWVDYHNEKNRERARADYHKEDEE